MKPWFCLSIVVLSGCSYISTQPGNYPPTMPVEVTPPPKKNGTIYQAGYDIRLYQDKVARRVGDLITVKLEESTAGKYQSSTKTDKKAKINLPSPTILKPISDIDVFTDTQQTFEGKGDTDQKDELTGTLTVTVSGTYPNGNLMIQGESWVGINQSRKFMQLKGIVRQEDIQPDNTVSSQRIAAAQITYGANGQAGDASSGGLLTKFFNRFAPY